MQKAQLNNFATSGALVSATRRGWRLTHEEFARHGTITSAKPLRSRLGVQRAID
jgi:hypothetical protein